MNKNSLDSRSLARLIAQSAFDLKAFDLQILDLRKLTSFTDYFIIASGRSDRQVQAICNRIRENLENHSKPLSLEGFEQGHWILIDYGDVVAHIFYEEVRPFYNLERLWGDAPKVRFRLK